MDSGSIFPGYFSSYAMHDPVLTLSQVLKQPLELRGLQWGGFDPKQLHKRRKKLINNFLCLLFVWDWYMMNFNVVTRLFVYQSRIKNYRGGGFQCIVWKKREHVVVSCSRNAYLGSNQSLTRKRTKKTIQLSMLTFWSNTKDTFQCYIKVLLFPCVCWINSSMICSADLSCEIGPRLFMPPA